MYKVYIDGELAYYPGDELLVLTGCELHLALNDSGTFEFDITPDSAIYDRISSRVTMVQVLKDDNELFYGEVRDISRDLYNVKHVYCVGELAFLFDSIQPQAVYHDLSPRQMLETWLLWHNDMTEAKKHFQVGIVTIHDNNDSIYRFTNEEPTLEAIREKLLDKLGGYLKIRKVDGIRYLDWLTLADYGKICEQPIKFGMNLLDYSEDTTADDLYTAVIPHGARLDESPVEGLEAYLDITSVNDGRNYLYIPEAVERYGWIMAVQQWDDVGIPANLKEKGEQWLSDNQYETMTLELNAVDLSVLSQRFDSFELGDRVHALAAPYGMDRYFPVQKLDIYLQEPNKNLLLLGDVTKKGYAEHSSNTNKKVDEKIDDVKVTTTWLQSAIENATQMITGGRGGYKVSEYDEDGRWLRDLYMNAPDKEDATDVMQVNMNGIGFSRSGFQGPYKNAWTIDGVLTGEFIKAGTVQAEALSTEYRQSVQKEIENAETGAKEYAESYTTTAIRALEDKITLSVNEKLSYVMHNYVVNGDFSDGLKNWTVSDATAVALVNDEALGKCVKFTGSSTKAYLRYTIYNIKAGKYKVRFKAAGKKGARMSCRFSMTQYTDPGEISTVWSQFEFDVVTPTDDSWHVYFYNAASGVSVCIKDIEILGGYEQYNEARITVMSEKIESRVSKNEFSSYVTQYYDRVITAFNDSSKYVQISAGEIAIYDGAVSSSKKRSAFNSSGNHFWRDGYYVGKIGTNDWRGNTSYKGLSFDLESNGKYMSWSYKKNPSDSFYTSMLIFFSQANIGNNPYAGLHLGHDLYTYGHTISLDPNGRTWTKGYSNGASIRTNDLFGIEDGSGNAIAQFNASRVVIAKNLYANLVGTPSDERLKDNITDSTVDALQTIMAMQMRSFDWIENGEHESIGLVAQEVEAIAPDLVSESGGVKHINPTRLLWYCVRAIQQIQKIQKIPAMNTLMMSAEKMTLEEKKAWIAEMKENQKLVEAEPNVITLPIQ